MNPFAHFGFTHFSFTRSLLLAMGASVYVLAGCSTSSGSGKTTGTGGNGGSGGATPMSASSSSSSGATSGAGASTTSTSTSSSTSASTSSSSTSSGADAGAKGCSSLPLCDDFESDTAGSPPNSSLWTLSAALGCQTVAAGAVTIDATHPAHSGKNSVKVTGATGSCATWFGNTSALAALGTTFYVRFYVQFQNATVMDHVYFNAMRDANISAVPQTQNSADTGLGMIQQYLVWSRASDDATMPDQDTMGFAQTVAAPPSTASWHCFEYGIDEAQGTIQAWLDSTEIKGLEENGTPVQGVNDQWISKTWRPKFADVRFGWLDFGGGAAMTLWFDDIAIGPSRIGCSL